MAYTKTRALAALSAQAQHEAIAQRYNVTGISMRDLIWPYYEKKRKPYYPKTAIVVDKYVLHSALSYTEQVFS